MFAPTVWLRCMRPARGDAERSIRRELGFSPLTNVCDGARFGSDGFMPYWDVIHDHGSFFEIIYTVGNDGFALVLFVQDAIGVEPDQLTLCGTYARTTTGGGPQERPASVVRRQSG